MAVQKILATPYKTNVSVFKQKNVSYENWLYKVHFKNLMHIFNILCGFL